MDRIFWHICQRKSLIYVFRNKSEFQGLKVKRPNQLSSCSNTNAVLRGIKRKIMQEREAIVDTNKLKVGKVNMRGSMTYS